MGLFVVGEHTQTSRAPLYGHVAEQRVAQNDHLWCGAGQCYFVSEECACKFCGCDGVDKYHLLRCQWASCEQMNRDNIRQIVKVLHACNRHT